MNNRNPIKQWSITFPRTEMERKAFADTFPPAEEVICSREEHEDGGYHLHLSIKLKRGLSKSKLLKWIETKFPNDYKRIDVQATRSIDCWAEYISKEDPDRYEVRSTKKEDNKKVKIEEEKAKLENNIPLDEWKKLHKPMYQCREEALKPLDEAEQREMKEALEIDAIFRERKARKMAEAKKYEEYLKSLGY